jgi:hypothetical protein
MFPHEPHASYATKAPITIGRGDAYRIWRAIKKGDVNGIEKFFRTYKSHNDILVIKKLQKLWEIICDKNGQGKTARLKEFLGDRANGDLIRRVFVQPEIDLASEIIAHGDIQCLEVMLSATITLFGNEVTVSLPRLKSKVVFMGVYDQADEFYGRDKNEVPYCASIFEKFGLDGVKRLIDCMSRIALQETQKEQLVHDIFITILQYWASYDDVRKTIQKAELVELFAYARKKLPEVEFLQIIQDHFYKIILPVTYRGDPYNCRYDFDKGAIKILQKCLSVYEIFAATNKSGKLKKYIKEIWGGDRWKGKCPVTEVLLDALSQNKLLFFCRVFCTMKLKAQDKFRKFLFTEIKNSGNQFAMSSINEDFTEVDFELFCNVLKNSMPSEEPHSRVTFSHCKFSQQRDLGEMLYSILPSFQVSELFIDRNEFSAHDLSLLAHHLNECINEQCTPLKKISLKHTTLLEKDVPIENICNLLTVISRWPLEELGLSFVPSVSNQVMIDKILQYYLLNTDELVKLDLRGGGDNFTEQHLRDLTRMLFENTCRIKSKFCECLVDNAVITAIELFEIAREQGNAKAAEIFLQRAVVWNDNNYRIAKKIFFGGDDFCRLLCNAKSFLSMILYPDPDSFGNCLLLQYAGRCVANKEKSDGENKENAENSKIPKANEAKNVFEYFVERLPWSDFIAMLPERYKGEKQNDYSYGNLFYLVVKLDDVKVGQAKYLQAFLSDASCLREVAKAWALLPRELRKEVMEKVLLVYANEFMPVNNGGISKKTKQENGDGTSKKIKQEVKPQQGVFFSKKQFCKDGIAVSEKVSMHDYEVMILYFFQELAKLTCKENDGLQRSLEKAQSLEEFFNVFSLYLGQAKCDAKQGLFSQDAFAKIFSSFENYSSFIELSEYVMSQGMCESSKLLTKNVAKH